MTCSDFVKNTKHGDKNQDFTTEFLSQLYNEIKINPFTLDEVEEARAVGLYGEQGKYRYAWERNENILLKDFDAMHQLSDQIEDVVSCVSEQEPTETNEFDQVNMSEKLAVQLSPAIVKKESSTDDLDQKSNPEDRADSRSAKQTLITNYIKK